MRIALVVGVNYYRNGSLLHGCANDARAVTAVLERHEGGVRNFDCRLRTATGPADEVCRGALRDEIEDLFSKEAEVALFYFAGHGHIEATGGYLLCSDSARADEGVPLSEILTFANNSPARNKVIVLDSCHSGIAGTAPGRDQLATLSEGLTILTASAKDQYATEAEGRGVFTTLFVDGLSGGAAGLTGDITLGSVYAHIDQSLGAWEQRPIFKTNVRQFVSLRSVVPQISTSDLHQLVELFPTPFSGFGLDPTFEPEMKGREVGMPGPLPENTAKFAVLQRYNRVGLLRPVGADHMWHAAMQYKSCRLTPLGQHYWRLVKKSRI